MRVDSTCSKRPQTNATHKFQETWFVNGDGEMEDRGVWVRGQYDTRETRVPCPEQDLLYPLLGLTMVLGP